MMRTIPKKMAIILLFSFVLGCGLAAAGDQNEKTAARRKTRFEFMKKEHEKRWSFEDDLLAAERSFADGIRKDRREAEQKRDEALADAGDSKGEAEARRAFSEKEKEMQKRVTEERKSIADRRKAHLKEMEELRREFFRALNKKE